ncbi:hypothetical protein V6Z11_D05G217300 [Gossypium hirsutum]
MTKRKTVYEVQKQVLIKSYLGHLKTTCWAQSFCTGKYIFLKTSSAQPRCTLMDHRPHYHIKLHHLSAVIICPNHLTHLHLKLQHTISTKNYLISSRRKRGSHTNLR